MPLSPADLVRRLEGCKLQAYPDPASPLARHEGTDGRPWTIGYGHTGQGVGPGTVWTQAQADAQLEHDLNAFELVVGALVTAPLDPGQRAALVSFAYNEGSHRLSDPACRIVPLLNAGDYLSAAGQFLHWTKAGGVPGVLLSRRKAEVEVFLADFLSTF